LKKRLDGGLPSLQREKTFANSQNLGGGKFWLFADLSSEAKHEYYA
jgi:hypothetical protein